MKIELLSISYDPNPGEVEVSYAIGAGEANPRPSGTFTFAPHEIDPAAADKDYEPTAKVLADLVDRIEGAIERRLS